MSKAQKTVITGFLTLIAGAGLMEAQVYWVGGALMFVGVLLTVAGPLFANEL